MTHEEFLKQYTTMEIKLNAGDKITIPANCKATIKDNQIIIEEQKEFKDGDVLSMITLGGDALPFIYKGVDERGFYKFYAGVNYYDAISICSNDGARWGCDISRHATEEEKQRLFDKLKEQGLRWNAETKTMERIRKRAKEGETYLFINSYGEVCETTEAGYPSDDEFYNLGNYYYLPEAREQAEEDAKAVRALFEKRLKA